MEMILSRPRQAFAYHGLSTDSAPPEDNPVRDDVLKWKRMLSEFVTFADGSITVEDDPMPVCSTVNGEEYCARQIIITVTTRYGDYGKETQNVLTMKIPKE